ncbi:hypothetical protein [Yinghuangia seranimata]|uniref:hypothetical protein n=1 Tax=Yinghuangia seranimata TaxID=408067 RepID=UPI00248CB059|nr:hypothetical protein [Yinghuangia seranimata]MDI2129354.1 hypothetical protein [Yinghuangia seranimata]
MAWMVMLGLVAGAGVGYAVQSDRPAALPPLVAAGPRYPQPPADAKPVQLPAGEDALVRRDGDLRELLLPKPPGAADWEFPRNIDGWQSLAMNADDTTQPARRFSALQRGGVRRIAVRQWTADGVDVDIQLHQFGRDTSEARDQAEYMAHTGVNPIYQAGTRRDLPGTHLGKLYIWNPQDGSEFYLGCASAYRGDVLMVIWFQAKSPIDGDKAFDVAVAQAAKL